MIPALLKEPVASAGMRKLRLAYFVSHPIQYQAPLLKRIAQEPGIELKVFFASDWSSRGSIDKEFGVPVQWDTPLLDGYEHEFLPSLGRGSDSQNFLWPLNYGMAKRLRQGRFDALWIHGYHRLTYLRVIQAAHSLRIPVLLRTDSTLRDRKRSRAKLAAKKLFFHLLRPKLSAILSVGQENTAYWKHYLDEAFPIFLCPHAVDNAFFLRECAAAATMREEFRRTLGLDLRRPVILFAGKLIQRKRCADLLEAYLSFTRSAETQTIPYLLIVGDGEERAALEVRARQASPGDIRFLGFQNQSQLPRFYDLCNVFVLPSVDEPWGLAVNEVMNAARPVIVSDQVGCGKDLVDAGVNGLVFPAGDVRRLADCIGAVLASEETARRMGAESLRIVSGYNFERDVAGLREALDALIPGFALDPAIGSNSSDSIDPSR